MKDETTLKNSKILEKHEALCLQKPKNWRKSGINCFEYPRNLLYSPQNNI